MVWHGIHLSSIARQVPAIRDYIQQDPRLIDLQDDTYGMSPLIWSCVMGHDDVATWLLAHGASVDLLDVGGRSAIFYASKIGYVDLVTLLLQHKPDVRRQSAEGMTPLIIASACGHKEVVRALVDYVVAEEQEAAAAAATAAAAYSFTSITSTSSSTTNPSTSSTAYLDVVTKRGNSAVHCASRFPLILNILLNAGANPTLVNREGHTALEIATAKGVLASVRVLKKHLQIQESKRARWLYKVRALNDATHTLQHLEEEGKTRGDKRRKVLAAAPPCLKERVQNRQILPLVVVGERKGGKAGKKRKRKNNENLAPMGGRGGGGKKKGGSKKRASSSSSCVNDMIEEEEEDDEEEENKGKKEKKGGKQQPPTAEGGKETPADVRQAVLAYAVEGGLKSELFTEVIDFLLPKWDAERVEGAGGGSVCISN